MRKVIVSLLLLSLTYSMAISQTGPSQLYPFALEFNKDRSLIISFKEPDGYKRFPMNKMTRYLMWLTNLPLKPEFHPLIRYDKQIITRADSIAGVIDIGVTTNNQKDADFPIQLATEYLKVVNLLDSFPFILNENDTVTFGKWLDGNYSTDARGNVIYKEGEKKSHNEKEFYRFIEFIMRKNTNKTLINNLIPVSEENIMPGDMYIQFDEKDPDSSGHTLMILDICTSDKGENLYLIGHGGDPAQSYYVPIPLPKSKRVWFTMNEIKKQYAQYGQGKFYRFMNLINL
ncbi:MAG: DUF4846 domain-containing protein [Candidatus Zixiibacteriota bacterium]